MGRVVLSVFLIVLSILSGAQEMTGWKSYTSGVFSAQEVGTEQVFLFEGTVAQISNSFEQSQILRSLDESHHIIKAKLEVLVEGVWKVKNQWKVNLDQDNSGDLYYIITSETFDDSSLAGFDIVRRHLDSNTILIKGAYDKIQRLLLPNPDVIHVTNKVFKPMVESRVIDMNINPNRVNKIHHVYPALNGSTEIVSIQENQFNSEDIDLLNRSLVSGLESEFVDNHATEMATIIAGAGNSFVTGRGVANKATIISSDFFDAMPDSDEAYIDFGINIQNHSYGIIRASEYGVEARAFDLSSFENKNLLHVFSSGNGGLEVSEDGPYEGIEGYANLTGNIKMSKNSLVVGSVDTVGNVPAFVSRGPAYDGRIKPEIVAYSVVGSSNSAALVSGVATLLQQQYGEDHGGDMPSALTKALLINSAMDVGTKGVDFVTGYGNLNAWRSLESLRSNQFYAGSVSNGTTDSYMINVPSNAINLKVTICWTDPAANVNDFSALVNDLDLRLVDGSTTVLPWILDSTPNAGDLAKAAVRGVDDLNNVEQVTIEDPETSYVVEIVGSEVTGTQDFFVVWQYDLEDSFEWDFPTGSDNMPYNGETGSYFRWTTNKSGIATLSYSIDGLVWTSLDTDIDVSTGYWRWNDPPIIGGEVKARIEIGGETFETEFFTVSEPLSADVGFNCGDSVLLKWNAMPNAVDYTVKNLGNENLEFYETTSDTFLVIDDKINLNSRFFSIQPNLPGGGTLLPTPTFDYTLQGIECYVFSFFQTVALDTGIYLNLSLGTTYGIDRIVLERNNFNAFEEIEVFTNIVETVSFLDQTPNQGYNEHRATIYFLNGEQLALSAGTSFYLTEEPLRIFPNPIQAGEPFSIITREFKDTSPVLELIDDKGSLVHKQEVLGTQDVITTGGLRSGIYFYRLRADGQTYSGRVLVR